MLLIVNQQKHNKMINNQPKVSLIVLGEHHGETIIYKTLEKKLAEYAKDYQIKFLGEANLPSIDDNIRAKEEIYPQIKGLKELEKIYKTQGRTALTNALHVMYPQLANVMLSVIQNYNGFCAKKQCIDSLKKSQIEYVCVDNAIDRQQSDQHMMFGIPGLHFNTREEGMASEITQYITQSQKPTLIVMTTGFLHAKNVAEIVKKRFIDNQQIKVITGIFGGNYCDEKGNTVRPDKEQEKDFEKITALLESGLTHINKIDLTQFTVPNWNQAKADLIQSLGGNVLSVDEQSNAKISIVSCNLKGQRAKLEIYTAQKVLNKNTAKEQIVALKSLGDEITTESLGEGKIQVTGPIKYKEIFTEILDNFTQYQASKNNNFADYVASKDQEKKINHI